MDKKNLRALRRTAADALAANPGDPRTTAAVYIALCAGVTLAVNVLTHLLDSRIAQTGGLSNMGLRSILSTIRSVLPITVLILTLIMHMGYQKATLRMARRQAVTPRTLTEGLPAFGAMVRAALLQAGLYFLLMMFSMYASAFLFTLTPLSNSFYAIAEPLIADPEAMAALTSDPAIFAKLALSMWPVIPIFLVVFLLVAAPFFYGYRMVNYCILDNRGMGARMAMRTSVRMMKGSRVAMLKLDLSFWWFYLAQAVIYCIMDGNALLYSAGINLPWNTTVTGYAFMITGLALEALLYYFFMNRVETTYATVYDAIRPQSQPTQGVVLGNIFELAKEYKDN